MPRTDFESYFKKSTATDTTKRAYYVDVVSNYKDLDGGFQSYLNFNSLLDTLSGVTVMRMDKEWVDNLIALGNDFEAVVPEPDTSTVPQEMAAPTTSTQNPERVLRIRSVAVKKYPDWPANQARNQVVTIKMSLNADTAGMTQKLFDALITQLGNPYTSDRMAGLVKNHALAQATMTDIVTAFCSVRAREMLEKLSSDAITNKYTQYPAMNAAMIHVRNMSATKQSEILTSLHEACRKSIASMVDRKKPSRYLLEGYIAGVSDGTPLEVNIFKNRLREMIFSQLIVRGISASDEELILVRRILSEWYVNVYYAYVHFLYITELITYFKGNGDFVNMRVVAMTKVMFTINMLLAFSEKAEGQAVFNGTTMGKNNKEIVAEWVDKLKMYLAQMSKVDFNSEIDLEDIVADAHELSARVSQQSMSVDQLKNMIRKVQLEIRSILSRQQQIRNDSKRANVKYGLMLGFLFAIIIISTGSLMLGVYTQYLMYSLTGLIVLITTVSLIMLGMQMTSAN